MNWIEQSVVKYAPALRDAFHNRKATLWQATSGHPKIPQYPWDIARDRPLDADPSPRCCAHFLQKPRKAISGLRPFADVAQPGLG